MKDLLNSKQSKVALKAQWLDEFYRDTSIPNSRPLKSYERVLEDSKCHPVLHGKVAEQIEDAYSNLQATMDETRWTLEHLNELTEAGLKDAMKAEAEDIQASLMAAGI